MKVESDQNAPTQIFSGVSALAGFRHPTIPTRRHVRLYIIISAAQTRLEYNIRPTTKLRGRFVDSTEKSQLLTGRFAISSRCSRTQTS